MSDTTTAFVPEFAVFMLVKTTPEWLAFTVDHRFELLREQVTPILERHKADVRLRFFDCEFYSARVTDLWMWEARSHHSYQLVVEALRETAFWDRYFEVVEILTGIEDAYAKNYEREPIGV